MNQWQITITKYSTDDDSFSYLDKLEGTSLVAVLTYLAISLGKMANLMKEHAERNASRKLYGSAIDDDIPF